MFGGKLQPASDASYSVGAPSHVHFKHRKIGSSMNLKWYFAKFRVYFQWKNHLLQKCDGASFDNISMSKIQVQLVRSSAI